MYYDCPGRVSAPYSLVGDMLAFSSTLQALEGQRTDLTSPDDWIIHTYECITCQHAGHNPPHRPLLHSCILLHPAAALLHPAALLHLASCT